MKLLNSIYSWLHLGSQEQALSQNDRLKTRREREIYKLITRGRITLAEIEGNCPSKEIVRLRRTGYVHPLGHPSERWEVNPRTGCKFKVYKWTGKVPPNWVACSAYVGVERRKKQRGGK